MTDQEAADIDRQKQQATELGTKIGAMLIEADATALVFMCAIAGVVGEMAAHYNPQGYQRARFRADLIDVIGNGFDMGCDLVETKQ